MVPTPVAYTLRSYSVIVVAVSLSDMAIVSSHDMTLRRDPGLYHTPLSLFRFPLWAPRSKALVSKPQEWYPCQLDYYNTAISLTLGTIGCSGRPRKA